MEYSKYFAEKLHAGEFEKLDKQQLAKLFNIVYVEGQKKEHVEFSKKFKDLNKTPEWESRSIHFGKLMADLTGHQTPEYVWSRLVKDSVGK